MWSMYLRRRVLGIHSCGSAAFPPSWRNVQKRSLASERPSGTLRGNGITAAYSQVAQLRKVQSLRELRLLCSSPSQGPAVVLSDTRLPALGQLYVLRLIESSGVLREPVGEAPGEDVRFAETATWDVLAPVAHHCARGDVSIPRSKHVVGVVWHAVKITSSLASSVEGVLVGGSRERPAAGPSPKAAAVEEVRSRVQSRLALIRRTLGVVAAVLCRLCSGAVPLNGKDVQQLLMLAREGLFFEMTLSPSRNAREGRGAASLERELEAARRDALRAIEVLAEQYAQVMSDSELVSVFVSCCTKDVSKSLVSFLAQCLKDRAAKGALDITMSDGIALFNASKDYAVPKEALSVLFAQFENSPFRDCKESRSAPGGAGKPASGSGPKSLQGQGATKEWRSSVSRATLCEIGRLCRSLYHLECNERLLRNLDNALSFSLNSPNFCSRICSRNRSGNHGLNSAVLAVSSIVHLLARNNYRNNQSVERLLLVLPAVPWNYDAQDELVLLVDLCWSLLSLRIEAWRVSAHLDKLFERLPLLPLKHCVKLLGGLYHSVGGARQYLESPSSCERVPMDDLLAYTLNDGESSHVKPLGGGVASKGGGGRVDPDYDDVAEYLHALRALYMGRIEEVTDIQGLSNFMFYAAATLEDLTHDDYNVMCRRWLEISRRNGFRVKVEALSQVLWALQKNRIYHEALLFRVRDILQEKLGICSLGQLSLMTHTFLTFNINTPQLMEALLRRLEDLVEAHLRGRSAGHQRHGQDVWDLKLSSVIWSIIMSDFTTLHATVYERVLGLLRRVNWPQFAQVCRHQDLRKVLQMYTSLEVELPRAPGYVASESHCHLIPDYVISAAIRDSTSVSSVAPVSASQDKARRSLMSFGVRFKGEYEVYHGIVVDFALTRNREPEDFVPHLVIEIDGPHHYNVICDEYFGPALQVGALRLLPNGKTLFRNRIMRKLGFSVETISWVDAHRRPIHQTLGDILQRHNFRTVKRR